VACALVRTTGDDVAVDRIHLAVEEPLPALALAAVLGASEPPPSVSVSVEELGAAIVLLGELEQELEVARSSTHAWQFLHQELDEGGGVAAVFLERVDADDADDRAVAAVLAHLRRGRRENPDGTTSLWRPVGPEEMELLQASGMRAWPPRLPDQPIFYPVLNETYARQIARDWNVSASGAGYVTRFDLATSFARRYPTRQTGGPQHLELWIPADQVGEVNQNLHGLIEVVG